MQAQGRRTQPEALASTSPAGTGSSYRFLVRSAEEAVGAIRKQLGGEARVVSVRSVKATGLTGLFGGTRLEVIAQASAPALPTVEQPVSSMVVPAEVPAAEPLEPRRSSTPAAVYGSAVSAATLSPKAEVGPATDSVPQAMPQKLEALLRRSGLSEPVIARLQATPGWPAEAGRPLHQDLSAVAGLIRAMVQATPAQPLPARAAFLGLPGGGCTTALCKWLSAEVFSRKRHGVAVSVEFDRPKTAEELAVFAELLGVDFARQVPAAPEVGEGCFCYVDMPALSLTREAENARLRAFLDAAGIPGRVLVVSGLLDAAVLRQACAAGQRVGCTHIVFTQLDELPQWGKLWDFLIEAPLTPLLATLGPSLSGECETDVTGAVLRRSFPWA